MPSHLQNLLTPSTCAVWASNWQPTHLALCMPFYVPQDAGLLISRRDHGAHHKAPFNCKYSIVSGWSNPLLDGDCPGKACLPAGAPAPNMLLRQERSLRARLSGQSVRRAATLAARNRLGDPAVHLLWLLLPAQGGSI